MEQVLVGERWRRAGRACDLVWLVFGHEPAEFALHLQCRWRVFCGEERCTGSGDVYLPPSGQAADDFDWDVQGANRFDLKAAELTSYLEANEVVVTEVEISGEGDLTIRLTDGFVIDARATRPADGEDWRFFRRNSDESHVVVPPEG